MIRIFTPLLLLASMASGPPLDEKIALVLPKPGEEKWLKIAWRTDLTAARAEAQRSGKPLFLWIMNGHPLGCT